MEQVANVRNPCQRCEDVHWEETIDESCRKKSWRVYLIFRLNRKLILAFIKDFTHLHNPSSKQRWTRQHQWRTSIVGKCKRPLDRPQTIFLSHRRNGKSNCRLRPIQKRQHPSSQHNATMCKISDRTTEKEGNTLRNTIDRKRINTVDWSEAFANTFYFPAKDNCSKLT